jgi:hypothetical protein
MKCKLAIGGKCYKENPAHKKEFAHPQDDDWESALEPPKDITWLCSCGAESKESFKFCSKCMQPRPASSGNAPKQRVADVAEEEEESEEETEEEDDDDDDAFGEY